METLISVGNAVKIAVGLGLVIFIHELGHFLMAKWNGVKVEKFSIGFGPTLLGFKRGETEYVIAALPLGGFVKMLGESPEDEASKSTDPRAYPNKSVSARMAIISAGVIMNVFLAFGCFAFYYANPRVEQPPVLGVVTAGGPAYQAGLRPGDEFVSIDGRGNLGYADLLETVVLSSSGQVIHFQIRRPGVRDLVEVALEPSTGETSDRPTIGVLATHSMELAGFRAPAGMAEPIPKYQEVPEKEFQTKVDVLVAAAPVGQTLQDVPGATEYAQLLSKHRANPLAMRLERRKLTEDGEYTGAISSQELAVPPVNFVDFGISFALEPISEVRRDSPADAAGFRKGDLITKIDGQPAGDPMRLPGRCSEHAGKPTTFEVERPAAGGKPTTIWLTATPDETAPYRKEVQANEPVDVPSLGFCYPIDPKIVEVVPDSPAAKAGLKPGDVISALTLKVAEPPSRGGILARILAWFGFTDKKDGGKPKTTDFEYKFSDKSASWWGAFVRVQDRQYHDISLTLNNASKGVSVMPRVDPKWFYTVRGFEFQGQRRTLPAQPFKQAISSGFHRTVRAVMIVYATFRSLFQRRVSIKHLGGPIMIFRMGYSAAGTSFPVLVFFLGFLSVNLAVLNFLPIPPLDGGQLVFLIAEKVRGRPLPDSAVMASQWVGLIFVLCLMVFVTGQDIYRWVTGWLY